MVTRSPWLIVALALQSVRQRSGGAWVTGLTVATLVCVLVSCLSVSAGLFKGIVASSDSNRVIIVSRRSMLESNSALAGTVADGLVGRDGIAVVSQELRQPFADLASRRSGAEMSVPFRGVTESAFALRPEFEVVEGRAFDPGKAELVVGTGASSEFHGLELGDRVPESVGRIEWEVVGKFRTGNAATDAEVWGDLFVAQNTMRGGHRVISSAWARLDEAHDFDALVEELADVGLSVFRERAYREQLGDLRVTSIRTFAFLLGGILVVGATLVAVHAVYSSIVKRLGEFATLEAMGFPRTIAFGSLLVESLAVAVLGAASGTVAAFVLFDGLHVSTVNPADGMQLAFELDVTPGLCLLGLSWGLAVGALAPVLGLVGLLRLNVAQALVQGG